mgnify:CR=1 FL=1
MHKPYLIDGLKFDMRIYVLVYGVDPLRVFVFREGLARFATEEYSKNMNDDNLFMHLTNYAINYFTDEVEPKKKYKKPNDSEQKALKNLISVLKQVSQDTPAEEIQTKIYTAGKENGYSKNLRDWFKLIYQVCFGEENGPRMGFFISFFGVKETIDLMEKKLKI